jgi:NADH-quinone oxidoreductase subunit J
MIQQLEMGLFLILSVVAVVAALGVVFNRNAIYSALCLLLNFVMLAGLYLLLNAQFIAMIQIVIYAGAIVVLFLFVEMLLGAEGTAGATPWLTTRNVIVVVMALALLTLVGAILFEEPIGGMVGNDTPAAIAATGQVQAIGASLFTQYVLIFELAGLLMLVGLVGALVLSQQWRPHENPQTGIQEKE